MTSIAGSLVVAAAVITMGLCTWLAVKAPDA